MICPSCGLQLLEGSSGCPQCGTDLVADSGVFAEAKSRYQALLARRQRAELDEPTFQQEYARLPVRDALGRAWLPAAAQDQWFLWDGQSWVPRRMALVRITTPPIPPSPTQQQWATQPPPRRRKHPVRTGCLMVFMLVALLVCGTAAWMLRLPERVGLIQSPAERVLSEEPDRRAADALLEELTASGVDTTGMTLYVLPVRDQSESIAYAVLDASAGFQFDRSQGDVVIDFLVRMATEPAVDENAIGRIALDYRDENGNQVVALTAPTKAIRDFASGAMTREAFMQELDGKIDAESLVQGGLM